MEVDVQLEALSGLDRAQFGGERCRFWGISGSGALEVLCARVC